MFDMSAWTEFKNPEDRTNAGLKLRERFPLSSHAVWRVQTKRRDVIGLLEEQNKMRVPDLVPLRFKRMSANAFTEDKVRCREAGMDGHLTKPIDSDKLIDALAKIMAAKEG